MNEVAIAIISGLLGGIIGPVVYDEYRQWRRERSWAMPRKKLLKELLGASDFRSLETLSRVSGTSPDDCRTLLIELNARGSLLEDGREGWTLQPIGTKVPERSLGMADTKNDESK